MSDFDVFLAHNSHDKAAVKRLAQALRARDIRYWLDLEQLRPGKSWQTLMEQGINGSASIAVCVGSDGMGPWQDHELQAAMQLGVERERPVIPLLLPGAGDQPELPLFLRNHTWVDLRAGLRKPGLDELIWGITGVAPSASNTPPDDSRSRSHSNPDPEADYLQALRTQDQLCQPDLYIQLQGEHRQRQPQLARAAAQLFMCPELRFQPQLSAEQESSEHPGQPGQPGQHGPQSFDDILDAFPGIRRGVLLGEPGAGKTTSLWKIARDALGRIGVGPASQPVSPDRPLPLIARLGDWTDPAQGLMTFLASQSGLAEARIQHYLERGQLLLLLDGLNEIPLDQQRAKAGAIDELLQQQSQLAMVISCRGADYRDHLRLPLDTVSIRPLTPSRIRNFLGRYLPAIAEAENLPRTDGQQWAEQLFWELAGGADIQAVWRTWQQAGAGLDAFWATTDIQQQQPAVWDKTSGEQDRLWRERVASRYNLMRLAENPFLLSRLVLVWLSGNRHRLPGNRGQLFELFTLILLKREGLSDDAEPAHISDAGQVLLAGLGRLAWQMQNQGSEQTASESDNDSPPDRLETARTSLSLATAHELLGQQGLDHGIATSLIEAGANVRFSHQLIQEYFTALGMRERLQQGQLDAGQFWPVAHWWRRSGWEEAAVLLAGLYHQDCSPVLDWLAEAQPVVAADCIRRSGAVVPDATLERLGERWLARFTDSKREPDPPVRSAVGLALGTLGDPRPGVGLNADGLPDIAWVKIDTSRPFIYQQNEKLTLPGFHIARYPITNAQFQAFIDAGDGHANRDWWVGFEGKYQPPQAPRWSDSSCLRETVSWYQALAFCRWLSARLDYEVSLPSEQQWERAARFTDGREYPWGEGYQSGHANINEGSAGPHCLQRTSPVGNYPRGRSAEGVDDLVGNVWEWCLNKYKHPQVIEADDSGDGRVLRGGSWFNSPDFARAAARYGFHPRDRNNDVGFRVLCAAPPYKALSAVPLHTDPLVPCPSDLFGRAAAARFFFATIIVPVFRQGSPGCWRFFSGFDLFHFPGCRRHGLGPPGWPIGTLVVAKEPFDLRPAVLPVE